MTYLRVQLVQTSTSTREAQSQHKAIQSSQLDSCKFGILLEPVTSSQVPGSWICISDYTSKWGPLHSQGGAVAHLHRILSAEEKIGDQFLPKSFFSLNHLVGFFSLNDLVGNSVWSHKSSVSAVSCVCRCFLVVFLSRNDPGAQRYLLCLEV